MKNLLRHFFTPHTTNNHKAKILHHDSMLILSVIILVGSLFLSHAQKTYSQVIGPTIDIAVQDLLTLTNQYRQQAGVGPLVLNAKLSNAAAMKAQDMFIQNYWAHNNPEGKMPWDFIKEAGYDYAYAGENLARGFTYSKDVIDAWMASPTHKENMLSPNYREVGFAVERGNLTGEKNTILVVEEFGSQTYAVNTPSQNSLSQQVLAQTKNQGIPQIQITTNPLFNSTSLTRNLSVLLLVLFIVVFIGDLIIIKRKSIVRIVGHNMDHVFFLSLVLLSVFLLQQGAIF